MFQEMSLKDALKKYIAGKKVLCLQIYEDGRVDANDLSDFLEGKQLHYLVDVVAVKNPDFEEAVQKMVSQKKPELKEKLKSPHTKPKATKQPANKKIDDELARKLLAEGKTQSEIAKIFGVKSSTMSIWVKKHKEDADADRKCGTCKYRDNTPGRGRCNYLTITGHSRGCSAENCSVYEAGEPGKEQDEEM